MGRYKKQDVQEPCSEWLRAWTSRTERTDPRRREVTQYEGAMMGYGVREPGGSRTLSTSGPGLATWRVGTKQAGEKLGVGRRVRRDEEEFCWGQEMSVGGCVLRALVMSHQAFPCWGLTSWPQGWGQRQAGGQEGGAAPFLRELLSHLFGAFG